MTRRACTALLLPSMFVACAGDAPPDIEDGTNTVETAFTLTSSSIAVMASADAYVQSGTRASTNFGTATSVETDKDTYGAVQRGLVRFDIPASAGTITKATLRMYVTNSSTSSADVFVTSNSWSESTVTWNNQPAATGSAIAGVGATSSSTWVTMDVTSVVSAGASLSLVVMPRSSDGFWFASREASANQPQLILELASAPPPPPTMSGTTTTIAPDADTFARAFYPDRNFGTSDDLASDLAESASGDVEVGYIRFHVGDVGNIVQATLRMYVDDGTASGPTLWTTSATDWSETGLTWNNRPAVDGLPIARIGSAGGGTWVELDVTSAVAANQPVSFAIVPNTTDGIEFDSRQSGHPPQLVVTTAAPAAANNPNCTLIVPDYPLSAQGLATPYQLTATDPGGGPCSEANADQRAFVEAVVLDPTTGAISVYHPLVIDAGTQAAVAPVVPALPSGAVVGIWFGYNGDTLALRGATSSSLGEGKCVNGLGPSLMGQFAHCNGVALFAAAHQAISAGKLHVPALAVARDGQVCPTSRSFAVVDQDQSDNVVTTYLLTSSGRLAQNTAANRSQLGSTASVIVNGSDERLTTALDKALGCSPWTAPDLADPGATSAALALNELMAGADQSAPVATVPVLDPFTLVDGFPSLAKLNLYRAGVDQGSVDSLDAAWQAQQDYCNNLLAIGPTRIKLDAGFTNAAASPDPGAASTLFTFLAQRFNGSWGGNGGLNCAALTGKTSPIVTTEDSNGVTISASVLQ